MTIDGRGPSGRREPAVAETMKYPVKPGKDVPWTPQLELKPTDLEWEERRPHSEAVARCRDLNRLERASWRPSLPAPIQRFRTLGEHFRFRRRSAADVSDSVDGRRPPDES